MPKKTVSQLSPSYAKRIARAEALGKTRQQARGHKEKEHVIRKQKEIERGGLTTGQKQQIKKFAEKQLKRTPYESVSEFKEAIIEWIGNDYSIFLNAKNVQTARRKDFKHNPDFERMPLNEYGDYIVRNVPNSENAPLEWFYYH